MPSQVNSYIDLDYLRQQKAKELGVKYDERTYYQAFFEEKRNKLRRTTNAITENVIINDIIMIKADDIIIREEEVIFLVYLKWSIFFTGGSI